jgi:hypothetical protein
MLIRKFAVLRSPDDVGGNGGGGADVPTTTTSNAQTQSDASGDDGDIDISTLPPAAQKYIKSLRAEAAEKRKALQAMATETSKREQERLQAEGKWKELAEARERELMGLKPYEERASTLETILKQQNAARIAQIPEDMRTIIPSDYAPERLSAWLDANVAKLTRPIAPNLDAGAGGMGGTPSVKLTDDEMAIARKVGMTAEQYAKWKK